MVKRKVQLIVALDVETMEAAEKLVGQLSGDVQIYKVGSQLFTACGPAVVRFLMKAGKQVFLDLKFHDIPNTVANAVKAVTAIREGNKGVLMCTLHTVGGEEMMRQAVAARMKAAANTTVKGPMLLGITVLTSEEKKDSIGQLVLERALLAKKCGLDGVVASSQEAAMVRQHCGDDFLIITPGIRPAGAQAADQKRISTPSQAQAQGSDYLVVGRPIVQAENPSQAVKQVLQEMAQ